MFEDLQQRAGRKARRIGTKAAIGLIAAVLAVAGLLYLADAGWRYLAITYDAIIASVIAGLVLLAASLLLLLIAKAIGPGRPPPAQERQPSDMTDAECIALLLRGFRTGREAGRTVRENRRRP